MKQRELDKHKKVRAGISIGLILAVIFFGVFMYMDLKISEAFVGIFVYIVAIGIIHVQYRRKHHLVEKRVDNALWEQIERYAMIFGFLGFLLYIQKGNRGWYWLLIFVLGGCLEIYSVYRNRIWIDGDPDAKSKAKRRRVEKL